MFRHSQLQFKLKCFVTIFILTMTFYFTRSRSEELDCSSAISHSRTEHKVANYEIFASLDPESHHIFATGTIDWVNHSISDQRELYVHLYMNAYKNNRSLFLRTPIPGFRGNWTKKDGTGWIRVNRFYIEEMETDVWPEHPATDGDPLDETDIHIFLPEKVSPGEAITIRLEWEVQLPEIILRTGYVDQFHMVGQWFPKIAMLEENGSWAHFPLHPLSEFYANFGDYDVSIDVPEDYFVAATGKIVEQISASNRKQFRFVQENVHDFVFGTWNKFKKSQSSIDEKTITFFYPSDESISSQIELKTLQWSLPLFEKEYGKYPYKQLTVVHPPNEARESGGMEYPTLITTGENFFSSLIGFRFIEQVTVHELAHQWFYGIIASNENAFPFLDEGLTTFAEMNALGSRLGMGSFFDRLGFKVSMESIYRYNAVHSNSSIPILQSAFQFRNGFDYGSLVYSRFAILLQTFGNVYGREKLRRALNHYAEQNRFKHPGPSDFFKEISCEMGEKISNQLRIVLENGGGIDFSVKDIDSNQEGSVWHNLVKVQKVGSLSFPVTVEFHFNDGSITEMDWHGGETSHEFEFDSSSKLHSVEIDPKNKVLLDDNLWNNSLSNQSHKTHWRSWDEWSYFTSLALWAMGR